MVREANRLDVADEPRCADRAGRRTKFIGGEDAAARPGPVRVEFREHDLGREAEELLARSGPLAGANRAQQHQ